MASGQLGTVIQHFRKLAASQGAQVAQELTDGQLLERFSVQRDELAFSSLLARHGALVWNVCRHVLHNDHDAEDAFQATFLVLARKARSINKVGGWLHRVAFLSAMEMKRKAARRRAHEKQATSMPQAKPQSDLAWRELLAVLDEEVQRLPEKYREPFVLCCLEAKSKAEAAKQLGWKEGTVSGRLAQARQQLQNRLTRRGITLSAGLTAAVLSNSTGTAAVPIALAQGTLRQVFLFTAGKPGMVSSSAAALAEAVMKSMMVTKLKVSLTLALLATFLAGGIGLAAYQVFPATPLKSVAQDQTPVEKARASKTGTEDEANQVRSDFYGDPLPEGAIARLGTTRLRHGHGASWMQFTPDGKSLISHGNDGVRVWKADTGEQLHFFPSEGWGSLSADGKLFAVSGKSAVHLHEIATVKRLKSVETGPVIDVLLSPDVKMLAVQQEKAPHPFELWDTTTGQRLRSWGGDPSFPACLAFADSGKTLITGGSRSHSVPPAPHYYIRFWDVASGREIRHFDLGPANPTQVAPSPDGRLLAVICHGERRTENRIRIWDMAEGKEIRQLVPKAKGFTNQTAFSRALAFSPDGKTLYAGALEGKLFAWNPATGEELRRLGTGFGAPGALAVSPDNKTLAASDKAIRLIDATTGKDRIAYSAHNQPILRMAVTPDGRTAITHDAFGSSVIFVWDATTGRPLRRLEGDGILFRDLQLINEGRSLLTVEQDKSRKVQTLRVQELDTGKELRRIDGPWNENEGLLVTPNGKVMTASPNGDDVIVRELDTGKEVGKYSSKEQGIHGYGRALLPDGTTLAIWGADNLTRLWDLPAGRVSSQFAFHDTWGPNETKWNGDGEYPYYLAKVSPDGCLMAFGSQSNNFIEVRELPTGEFIRKLESVPDRPAILVFSPDGKALAWTGSRAPTVHLVELATGRERHAFTGHKGGVWALAFSADGRTLISGSSDTSSLVWDLTGRLVEKSARGKPLAGVELDACWKDLAGADAARAFQAIRRLAASPHEAVPLLLKHLQAVPAVDENRLVRLIAGLDSDQFDLRQKASKELEKLGELAAPACRKALEQKPSAEVRRRLDALLKKQKHETWNLSADRLRMVRAIEALEYMATREAKQVLATLAKGASEARLTQEAKATLERLDKRAAQGP